MKYAIIAILVLMAIALSNKLTAKKHDEVMNDPTVTPHNFTITNKNGLFTAIYIIAAIFFVGMGVLVVIADGVSALLIVPVGFILLAVYGLMELYVWRIQVIGNDVIFRNTFGKEQKFNINEITRVTAKRVNNGADRCRLKVFAGDRKLFTIGETTDDVYLLQRLEELGVPIEER